MKFSKFGKQVPAATPAAPELGMTPALAEVREIIGALRESVTDMQTATGTLREAASAFEQAIKGLTSPAAPVVTPTENEGGQESPPVDST